MKITVINGSPKGKYSVTLQTVLYLQKVFKQHDFEIFHVGQTIREIENKKEKFDEITESMRDADLILFAYPVYTFVAPCQLHRFIELLHERRVDLKGKYVSQLTTSKHFYDVTAHRFIEQNCMDLGMLMIEGLSADMDDLLTAKGQRQARDFFRYLIFSMKKDYVMSASPKRALTEHRPVKQTENRKKHKDIKPVVIVADLKDSDDQLQDMVDRFRAVLDLPSRVVNIRDLGLKGGCISCFHCSAAGSCIYKDGFDETLRGNIQSGSAIVYAFDIRHHSMGSMFKMYDDRQFCNGHRTVTSGSPTGYLVCGSIAEEPNLKMILEARAQVGGNFLAGIADDASDPDGQIDMLAEKLSYAVRHKYQPPQNFYGVGGMKIFRDLIYTMQGMMRADHQYFKQQGLYDFPQYKKGTIAAMYLVGAMMNDPKIRKKIGGQMNEGMISAYRKVIDQVK